MPKNFLTKLKTGARHKWNDAKYSLTGGGSVRTAAMFTPAIVIGAFINPPFAIALGATAGIIETSRLTAGAVSNKRAFKASAGKIINLEAFEKALGAANKKSGSDHKKPKKVQAEEVPWPTVYTTDVSEELKKATEAGNDFFHPVDKAKTYVDASSLLKLAKAYGFLTRNFRKAVKNCPDAHALLEQHALTEVEGNPESTSGYKITVNSYGPRIDAFVVPQDNRQTPSRRKRVTGKLVVING